MVQTDLGEKIKLDLSSHDEYIIRITTPSNTFIKKSDSPNFIFNAEEIGIYIIEVKSDFGNIGNKLTQGNSLSSSFFTGTLATIVATPCTAPFMGAALGYALSQSAVISFLIFTFLALGLSFPYLMISRFPQWLKFVPKP